ncbi:ribonuclease D [Geopseudomonas aromaticivorans]
MPAIDIRWILDDASLAACCSAWRTRSFVALDTEFMRVDTFYPIAALVQVSDGEAVWLIDPLQIRDWAPFAALLEDPAVVKVLHSCSEDLEVFKRLTGSLPQPLFDTQIAAGYLNIGFSMGYSRLVKELLGLDLPKDETRSDWLQRPLSEMQVRYAAEDVEHLCEVYRELEARLSADKRAWLLDDGAELVAAQREVSDPQEAWREVKLAWRLNGQQLAVLRALCTWREEQARRRDQPRNRILRERSLWPLARTQPRDVVALARIEDMHPRTVRQDGETLLRLIAEAAALPAEHWPAQLPEPLPLEASALLKKLRAVGQREGERLQIVPELMLRKKVLEALLKTGYPAGPYTLPDSLRGWRRALMGQALLDTLA